jgi:uncharacterized damage-inducible protein DinB
MNQLETVGSLIAYHLALTRKIWVSVEQITEEQFLQEDGYSRGSIRNLLVHLASTDRRWLAGLKDLPDVRHAEFQDYPDRRAAREFFEQVARDLQEYVAALTEDELEAQPKDIPATRAQVLLHMINHGTDHRATVLQKLHALGAPTFGQDYILWLWEQK